MLSCLPWDLNRWRTIFKMVSKLGCFLCVNPPNLPQVYKMPIADAHTNQRIAQLTMVSQLMAPIIPEYLFSLTSGPSPPQ